MYMTLAKIVFARYKFRFLNNVLEQIDLMFMLCILIYTVAVFLTIKKN